MQLDLHVTNYLIFKTIPNQMLQVSVCIHLCWTARKNSLELFNSVVYIATMFCVCSGALLKAAVCCANIIDITSSKTLQQQLKEKYGGGFEVQSWSNLPQGSGLGASSILSGALMAALLSAAGMSYDTDSLIHAVLHLEQMLTTGGGWQDQVGGLLPGIKLGRSEGKLPLKVESEVLKIDDEKTKRIVDHSLLVFTGKPRLAKNMLQVIFEDYFIAY